MTDPTDKQMREFNEWCGTKGIDYLDPERGLSFLFKYAVPKVISEGWRVILETRDNPFCYRTEVILIGSESTDVWDGGVRRKSIVELNKEDPALALFWALDKVREASK